MEGVGGRKGGKRWRCEWIQELHFRRRTSGRQTKGNKRSFKGKAGKREGTEREIDIKLIRRKRRDEERKRKGGY